MGYSKIPSMGYISRKRDATPRNGMDIFVCVARTENPTLFFTVKNVH